MHVTMELDGIPVAIWGDAACFEDGREFLEGWVNLDLGELAPIARKAKTIQYRTALPDEIAIWNGTSMISMTSTLPFFRAPVFGAIASSTETLNGGRGYAQRAACVPIVRGHRPRPSVSFR